MIDTKNWFQLRPMYSYIRKQAENEKFLRYLEIGGTFTLITIFLFFAILPTMTAIFSLVGEIKSKETFIKKVDTKVANVLKAQESFSQVQEKYSLIEDSFPSMANYYQGTSNLATIFRDSSVGINQIGVNLNNDDKNQKFFKTYQINISGDGQYSSAMDVVKKIFESRRLMDTASISISQIDSSKTTSAPNSIRLNLSSDLYFLPQSNEKK